MTVGRRSDQRMIRAAEVEELKTLAQDGKDMRAALETLKSKRLVMMERVRVVDPGTPEAEHARGWLEFESDLGDALLEIQRKRGEEAPF